MRSLVLVLAGSACGHAAPPPPPPAPAIPMRESHAGYDIIRNCGGETAVVRTEGTRTIDTVDAVTILIKGGIRATANHGRPDDGRRCVVDEGEAAQLVTTEFGVAHIAVVDLGALEPALAALGSWLVREDLRGEIDVVYESPIETQ